MQALRFSPVANCVPLPTTAPLDVSQDGTAAVALFVSGDGQLAASPAGAGPEGESLAVLAPHGQGEDLAWYLIPRSARLGVNGLVPPLTVTRLEPGALLSFHQGDARLWWLVSTLWAPQPAHAPPELGEKSCPICGGPLNAAPVVTCLCGRVVHLERPDQPADPDALNCWLGTPHCQGCGRPTTLEPQMIPAVPEMLLAPAADPDAL